MDAGSSCRHSQIEQDVSLNNVGKLPSRNPHIATLKYRVSSNRIPSRKGRSISIFNHHTWFKKYGRIRSIADSAGYRKPNPPRVRYSIHIALLQARSTSSSSSIYIMPMPVSPDKTKAGTTNPQAGSKKTQQQQQQQQQPSSTTTTTTTTKKKPRKNPARRKAERLINSSAGPETDSPPKTKPEAGAGRSKDRAGAAGAVSSGRNAAISAPAAANNHKVNSAGPKAVPQPAELSRQASAPSVVTCVSNGKASTNNASKPPLQSRKSATAVATSHQSPVTASNTPNANKPTSSSNSNSSSAIPTTTTKPPGTSKRKTPDPNTQPKSIATTTTHPKNNNNTTNPNPNSPKTTTPTNPHLTPGLLLGTLTLLPLLPLLHATHTLAGPEVALATALGARLSVHNLLGEIAASLRAGTYSADEALDVLRRGALGYAGEVEGGRSRAAVVSVVEGVVGEVERVRRERGG